MTRRTILAAILIAVAIGGAIALRIEPLYLEWLAGNTDKTSLEARRELIAEGVEVHVPDTDEEDYPTVLMFHGCAGPRMAFMRQWAEVFADTGYAAVIVDSTGPRGYNRQQALDIVCAGKALIGQERAGDVFAAIDIARADPRLDTDRLILAGWSHGAWTVMDFLTMDSRKRRPAGISGDLPAPPNLAGAIFFYPHCGAGALSKFRSWPETPPAVAFVAGEDQIVEPDKCISLFQKKIKGGAAIDMTIYPDAQHVFDDPFLEPDWIHWYSEEDHRDAVRRIRTFLGSLNN